MSDILINNYFPNKLIKLSNIPIKMLPNFIVLPVKHRTIHVNINIIFPLKYNFNKI